MVAANFPKSLSFVLKDEGGNDDDPLDHGGRTSRGITQREYTAWRAEHGLADLDVWQAPQDDINQIYKGEYWLPECDSLASGLDYMLFDMKVNAGPHRAIVLLQRAVGVNDDGRIGPVTRQAIGAADPQTVIAAYTDAKRAFYRSLHQPRFLKGWLNRCNNVQSNAETMIEGAMA
jgi:lysozyme family protein